MRHVCALTGTVAALLIVTGCSASRAPQLPTPEAPRPNVLIVEDVIAGRYLNQTLTAPTGLEVGLHGDIYVLDGGNDRLLLFDSTYAPRGETRGFGRTEGGLDSPAFVTADNDLNVWVSDAGNRRLCRFDRSLRYVSEIKLEDDEDLLKYGRPAGVAVTGFGEVWVCDSDNHRLAVFNNTGIPDRLIEGVGYSGGQLRHPEKIVNVQDRFMAVCDAGNHRIAFFDLYGTYTNDLPGGDIPYPKALAVDEANRLWVLDAEGPAVYCLTFGGAELLVIGPVIPGTAEPLAAPSDIAVDTQGRVLISDTGNNHVLVCRPGFADN